MFEILMVILPIFLGTVMGAVLQHFRRKMRSNPSAVAKDALLLAESIEVAARDRRITASELVEIGKRAKSLAERLR